MELLLALFLLALLVNARAVFKLSLDWKGMLTTVRFVRESYARVSTLPTEEALERTPATPVFLHLVPAYQEPDIAGTVGALGAAAQLGAKTGEPPRGPRRGPRPHARVRGRERRRLRARSRHLSLDRS